MLGPPDIEARIGLTGGQIFQGEAMPDQMWDRALRSPHAGAGSLPLRRRDPPGRLGDRPQRAQRRHRGARGLRSGGRGRLGSDRGLGRADRADRRHRQRRLRQAPRRPGAARQGVLLRGDLPRQRRGGGAVPRRPPAGRGGAGAGPLLHRQRQSRGPRRAAGGARDRDPLPLQRRRDRPALRDHADLPGPQPRRLPGADAGPSPRPRDRRSRTWRRSAPTCRRTRRRCRRCRRRSASSRRRASRSSTYNSLHAFKLLGRRRRGDLGPLPAGAGGRREADPRRGGDGATGRLPAGRAGGAAGRGARRLRADPRRRRGGRPDRGSDRGLARGPAAGERRHARGDGGDRRPRGRTARSSSSTRPG